MTIFFTGELFTGDLGITIRNQQSYNNEMKRIVKNARLWSTTERVVMKKMRLDYCILLSIVCTFYIESDDEIFPRGR